MAILEFDERVGKDGWRTTLKRRGYYVACARRQFHAHRIERDELVLCAAARDSQELRAAPGDLARRNAQAGGEESET